MNVTIIDGDVPYPPTSGKRLRSLNLLLPLAREHRITFIGRSQTPDTREAAQYLRDHGIASVFVHDPLPKRQGPRFAAGLAANLLSPLPYNLAAHRSRAMRAAVQDHARMARVDAWQIEWTGYDYCLDPGQRPVVLQAHNVDALIWQRYYETETRLARKAYIWEQLRKQRRHEAGSFARADKIVAVSRDDAALARALYGPLPIEVVANGVDVAGFGRVERGERSRVILFLGALDWRPNLDGLDMLIDRIFPALRERCPDARLMIVGRNPPAHLVRRVALIEGAELHADVPDVRPYIAAAAALAVPLRIGGGSRLKILEALASRLPVVSSRVGAEGLELEDGVHLRIAETPAGFATALAHCIEQPEDEMVLACQGRRFVEAHHDWAFLAARLERVWLQASGLAGASASAARAIAPPATAIPGAADHG